MRKEQVSYMGTKRLEAPILRTTFGSDFVVFRTIGKTHSLEFNLNEVPAEFSSLPWTSYSERIPSC